MSISVNTRSSETVSPAVAPQTAPQTGGNTSTPTENTQATDEEFDTYLRALLSSSGSSEVNEEELFAAVIEEQLQVSKGDAVAQEFGQALGARKQEIARGDGYINIEKAANMALKDTMTAGHLTEDEYGELKSNAFKAAQLDDNYSALYDGRGSAEDPTMAMAELETALLSARAALTALANGELPAGQSDQDDLGTEGLPTEGETITPNGTTVDGAEGFLFKPESESDGKLVILLPKTLTGSIEDLLLKDEDGNIIERGRHTGVANGDRDHYRFEKPGEDYPENLTVEARLSNGEVMQYQIANPGERYD